MEGVAKMLTEITLYQESYGRESVAALVTWYGCRWSGNYIQDRAIYLAHQATWDTLVQRGYYPGPAPAEVPDWKQGLILTLVELTGPQISRCLDLAEKICLQVNLPQSMNQERVIEVLSMAVGEGAPEALGTLEFLGLLRDAFEYIRSLPWTHQLSRALLRDLENQFVL